jgi:ribonuclease BN (tRNA processing enzyme)
LIQQLRRNDGEDIGRITEVQSTFLPTTDAVLARSIRSCIKTNHVGDGDGDCDDDDDSDGGDGKYTFDTEMSVCFLGTSAGMPVQHRSTSATLLRLGGANFLFDAGEGVQRQLQFVKGGNKLQNITRIFITHLHGDHIFGLPGLLLGLQNAVLSSQTNLKANRSSKTRQPRQQPQQKHHPPPSSPMSDGKQDVVVVKIYGPPGLYHYVASSIILSCTKLLHLRIEVHELVGGRVKRVLSPLTGMGTNGGRVRNPFYDDYPEYDLFGGELVRKQVPCLDGVWTLQEAPPPLTRDDVLADQRGSRVSRGRLDRLRIRAAEVDHLPGISTFGFVIEEPDPARNIDADRARALGVTPRDKKYELLKNGFSVPADDDPTREVHPDQVLKPPTKKSRKVAVVGDNRKWTAQMTDLARNADVLVHEATLLEEDYQVSVCTFYSVRIVH